MKKMMIFSILMMSIVTLHAQPKYTAPKYDALTFSGPLPQRLHTLNFSFNQRASVLKEEKNIDITVYEFTDKGLVVKEPKLKKTGDIYSGSILIDSNANTLAFGISNGENKDNNSGKGYIWPVYTKDNKVIKASHATEAQLYSGYGEFLFGMVNDPQKSLDIMDAAYKADPSLIQEKSFFNSYLQTIAAVKKKDAQPVIMEKLQALEMKPALTAEDYSTLSGWYGRFKNKAKADSLMAVMKQKYPSGSWVANERMNRFFREKNADKKAAIYDSVLAYPPGGKLEDATKDQMKTQLANAYRAEKKPAMFQKWTTQLSPAPRAAIYNDVSWNMAQAGEDIPAAKKMSEEASMWAKQQMTKPTEKKPLSRTTKQWEEDRKATYAMYGDTYAYILYNQGNYKEGLPYSKDAATINKLKDPELNERYAMLLVKATPAAEARPIIEDMVRAGKASPKTKDALKELYTLDRKSSQGFDAYVTGLEMEAKIKKQAEIAKSMINAASPAFSLRDWDGKEVSLESLTGKIVVVDFWATWCGPCIASMPGMKAAQEKLAARDDVKFLFVDTWETVDDKVVNSKDFMTKKNYPFYVLMDNDNKMVGDFDVSGIPTKFIIDKSGHIRFKAIGFEGNTDELTDEVLTMVDLAGK